MSDPPASAAQTAPSGAHDESDLAHLPIWIFPGWGEARRLDDLEPAVPRPAAHHAKPLTEWQATALCGNDITSSVLYVSALSIAQAGFLAPLVLLVVGGILYLFRAIYAEVVSALPLNGGTYTLLLNTTSKRVAAAAACLTLISYVATAVISGSEAIHYGVQGLSGPANLAWSAVLLGAFACLTAFGIGESARVALGIFILHLATLTVLVLAGATAVIRDPTLLLENWARPSTIGIGSALFYGLGAAMLGVSGFESSANFVEEQAPGVFPKTLRNMWRATILFNPLVALLALGLVPMALLQQAPPDLLARMGTQALGAPLAQLVRFDAFLVLCGAVLTSFVGVTGLVRRMSLDWVLPQWLLHENRWRGTNHWIILAFLALCVSILLATSGRIETLAGVYTLSFLSVMALFAIGNLLLKHERSALPREVRASVTQVVLALLAVLTALLANILLDPATLPVFAAYAGAAFAAVTLMFLRQEVLALALDALQRVASRSARLGDRVRAAIAGKLAEVSARGVVYFSKGDSAVTLNRAALYVMRNEPTNRLTVVHVHAHGQLVPAELAEQLRMIDRLYPELRIDFVSVEGMFGPALIAALSARLAVPTNAMFIGTPGAGFPHRVEALGGVRVIL